MDGWKREGRWHRLKLECGAILELHLPREGHTWVANVTGLGFLNEADSATGESALVEAKRSGIRRMVFRMNSIASELTAAHVELGTGMS